MTFAAEYEARSLENSDIRDHLPYLYEQARGKDVIELGVRSGNSTAAFLAAVEADGGHVWSVDIEWPHVPETWAESELWDFILGNDLVVAPLLPDQVDVVFVDSSHAYDHTVLEIEMYAPKVKPGGVMLFHDTELEHPDSEPGGEAFPVRRAIDEFVAECGWKAEFHAGCHGLGVLWRPT